MNNRTVICSDCRKTGRVDASRFGYVTNASGHIVGRALDPVVERCPCGGTRTIAPQKKARRWGRR